MQELLSFIKKKEQKTIQLLSSRCFSLKDKSLIIWLNLGLEFAFIYRLDERVENDKRNHSNEFRNCVHLQGRSSLYLKSPLIFMCSKKLVILWCPQSKLQCFVVWNDDRKRIISPSQCQLQIGRRGSISEGWLIRNGTWEFSLGLSL